MAREYSKAPLSGSTHGRGIKVSATSIGSGTTIHTGVASTSDIDLVTLFAYNDDTVPRVLTLGWGGTTDPDDLIIVTIAAQAGLALIVTDMPIRNSLVVKAAGSAADVIVLFGSVNQIRAV